MTVDLSESDPALLAGQIADGDTGAESRLYEIYKDRLTYFVRRKLRLLTGRADRDAVLDVCQNAWLAVLENLRRGELRHPEKASSYVYQVFSNKVVDAVKQRHREAETELLEHHGSTDIDDGSETVSPAVRIRFAKVWKQFTPREKRILYLKFVHGWSHLQIAGILGTSESNSRKTLQRARERVRRLVDAV